MVTLVMSLFQPAFDIFLIVIVATISITLRHTIEPVQRGFFCDDQSLQHPYHPSTLSAALMYSVSFFLPVTTVAIIEFLITLNGKPQTSLNHKKNTITRWLQICLHVLILFFYGAAVIHLTTNIAKYSLGRLRPHFIFICKPDYSLFNCSSGYIQDAHCTGDPKMIREARLSFVSGHSSMIVYTMIFALLYLEKRFTWKGFLVLKPFLQSVIFYLAFYTCMTRISDYKHHWSDVFGGAVLGIVVALLMIYKVHQVFEENQKYAADVINGRLCDDDDVSNSKATTNQTTVM